MKSTIVLLAVVLAASSQTLYAAPTCMDPASDSDGDGWGWENNQSCVVAESTDSACVDTDGDGWGWNGTESCLIETITDESTTYCIDSDGDGYGWDGSSTCLVEPIEEPISEEPPVFCIDTPPLNDTWGWDGTGSCRISPVLTPQDTSAIAGVYEISEEDYLSYLNMGSDGFFTVYESVIGDSCFYVINENRYPEDMGAQISPLGNNMYEIYYYENYNDYLYEDRVVYEMVVTENGSLSITFDDFYYDEFGNEVPETVTDLYPAANVVLEDLPICADPF